MESLKLSFFDLLTFLLPGGFFLSVIYWLLISNGLIQKGMNELDGLIILIPFLFLSYFFGHFISHIGKYIEKVYLKKNAWNEFLEKNHEHAKELDLINRRLFNKSFLDEELINPARSGAFFNDAYNYLTINQKKETFPILMAQYSFFKTAVAVWLLLFIAFLLTIYYQYCFSGNGTLDWLTIILALISFLSIFISINRAKERKRNMFAKVYKVFLSVNINPK